MLVSTALLGLVLFRNPTVGKCTHARGADTKAGCERIGLECLIQGSGSRPVESNSHSRQIDKGSAILNKRQLEILWQGKIKQIDAAHQRAVSNNQ